MTDPTIVIADRVRQLTKPYDHTERYLVRVADRQKIRAWHARHPSLLDQLRAALEPGSDDDGATSPDPAAPVALGALDVLIGIEAGSVRWVSARARVPLRPTVEGNLRALVGVAAGLGEPDLSDLAGDVESWWRWARVESSWDGRPRDLRGEPCPWCGRCALRVAWDVSAAWCRQCGATWGEGDLRLLGRMIHEQQRDVG